MFALFNSQWIILDFINIGWIPILKSDGFIILFKVFCHEWWNLLLTELWRLLILIWEFHFLSIEKFLYQNILVTVWFFTILLKCFLRNTDLFRSMISNSFIFLLIDYYFVIFKSVVDFTIFDCIFDVIHLSRVNFDSLLIFVRFLQNIFFKIIIVLKVWRYIRWLYGLNRFFLLSGILVDNRQALTSWAFLSLLFFITLMCPIILFLNLIRSLLVVQIFT